jgi:uncharacterized membrane protein
MLPSRNRIESIDLLKGLVIVIMALDHVRDYFHFYSFYFDSTDPAHTTVAIFFTRFVTNFCAPAFSFLAGLSAFMVGKRKNAGELSSFLLKRGLWLIFIELVVMNFGWHFDLLYRDVIFQVIWVLGISMVLLSGLIYLPRQYLIIFSCLLIFGHNLLDPVHFEGNILWSFIHERKYYPELFPGHSMGVGYSIIPWTAVMALGYCFGPFYNSSFDPSKRRKAFNMMGLAALLILIVLRWTNVYGDLLPRLEYGNFTQDFFSFLNLSKYPPSLCYLLLTLGAALLFLANTEKLKGRIVELFCVFGRVPFFFYILHVYLIHFLALCIAWLTGFGWEKMILPRMPLRTEALKGFGFNLVTVYLIWIGVIVLMYPLCKAFDSYKRGHKEKWWLSYL